MTLLSGVNLGSNRSVLPLGRANTLAKPTPLRTAARQRRVLKPVAFYIPPFPPEAYRWLAKDLKTPNGVTEVQQPTYLATQLVNCISTAVCTGVFLSALMVAGWWAVNFTRSSMQLVAPWQANQLGHMLIVERPGPTATAEKIAPVSMAPVKNVATFHQTEPQAGQQASGGFLKKLVSVPGAVLDNLFGYPSLDSERSFRTKSTSQSAPAAPAVTAAATTATFKSATTAASPVPAVSAAKEQVPAATWRLRLDHDSTALAIFILAVFPWTLMALLAAIKHMGEVVAGSVCGMTVDMSRPIPGIVDPHDPPVLSLRHCCGWY